MLTVCDYPPRNTQKWSKHDNSRDDKSPTHVRGRLPLYDLLPGQCYPVGKLHSLPARLHESPDIPMTITRRVSHDTSIVLAKASEGLFGGEISQMAEGKHLAAAFVHARITWSFAIYEPA